MVSFIYPQENKYVYHPSLNCISLLFSNCHRINIKRDSKKTLIFMHSKTLQATSTKNRKKLASCSP